MADVLPVRAPAFGAFPTHAAVTIRERMNVGVVSLHARGGATTLRVGAWEAPNEPTFVGDDELGVLGVGPGAWLAVHQDAEPFWADEIARELSSASVTDQSGAYALVRIEGPGAPALLAKGAFIDFDPAVFAPGSVAVTICAHIPVIVWRASDAVAFDVALFRSYAGSFAHWLTQSLRTGLPAA